MEPCIEIDPGKFVVVVGPRFTASLIGELAADGATASGPPIFAFKDIVNEGINLLLQADSFPSASERAKREMLYKNAYELDPTFALRKVADSLKKLGRYPEWLDHLFKRDFAVPAANHTLPSLMRLLDLQRKGALLVYVHCDDVLDSMAGLQPVLPEKEGHAAKWRAGEMGGFLHVHGVYSEPDTVKLDYEACGDACGELLRLSFEERHVVALGFDEHSEDPLLSRFWEKHVASRPAGRQTFFLSSRALNAAAPLPGDYFHLSLPRCAVALGDILCDTAETSWALCKEWLGFLRAQVHDITSTVVQYPLRISHFRWINSLNPGQSS